MSTRRQSVALALPLALGACITGCVRPSAGDEPPSAGSAAPVESTAHAEAEQGPIELDPGTRGWEAGSSYGYRFKLATSIDVGQSGQTFDFDLEGTLGLVATSVGASDAQLYAQVLNVRADRRVGPQKDIDGLVAELNRNDCFLILSGGRFVEMRTPKGMSAGAANTYRELASALQFARPARDVNRYVAEEYGTAGRYAAKYERGTGENEWSKTVDRYESLLSGPTGVSNMSRPVVPRVTASRGKIRLSPEGRPLTVDLREELVIQGAQAPVHSVSTVSLETVAPPARSKADPDWAHLAASMDRVQASEPARAATPEALDDAKIHGMSFDEAVAQLEKAAQKKKARVVGPGEPPLPPSEGDVDGESRAFVALTAIFRRHPETVAAAVRRIHAGSPASDALVSALGSSSSPRTLEGLAGLMAEGPADSQLRARILLAMSRAPRPSEGAIKTFKAVLDKEPYNTQALLGLGTYARRLRDTGDGEGARAIGEYLRSGFARAETPSQIITLLGAVTNSGYDGALPQVAPYLTDAREPVRAAAIRSLQSMHDGTIDRLLAACLENDESTRVRVSAIDAAGVRVPSDTLAEAVTGAAREAADPTVRYRAVELMAAWLPRRGELRPALEDVARTDAEERVRERARAAL